MTEMVDEARRLAALRDYHILDSAPESCFDSLVKVAATLFEVPTALISLVDRDRQWFKAKHGLDVEETPRDVSFCTHVVARRAFLEVLDALEAPLFRSNPLVTGPPHIRYYAGAPLINPEGHILGTLCLLDYVPRAPLDKLRKQLLQDMAAQAADLIELRLLRQVGRVSTLISETVSDAIVVTNGAGAVSYWNSAAERMFGWAPEEITGQSLARIMPERFREAHQTGLARVAAGGERKLSGVVEVVGLRKDGSEFPIELSLGKWSARGSNSASGFAAIIRDISERKALSEDRERSRRFLKEVVDNLPSMLFVKNAETRRYEFLNRAGEELIGRPRSEVIGCSDVDLFPDRAAAFRERDDRVLATGEVFSFESDFPRPDGERRRARTKRVLVQSVDEDPFILGITDDVTERHRAETKLAHLAHRDPLTGLRNRAGAEQDFAGLCSSIGDGEAVLISIDLDRFKAVNDLYGHAAGDAVLAQAARRIGALLPEGAAAARLDGDEFLVMFAGGHVGDRAARLSTRIIDELSEPLEVGEHSVQIGASAGIAMCAGSDCDFESICRSAELALARAKKEGRSRSCFFDPAMDQAAAERRLIEVELRKALENGEIQLHFQPLVSLQSGQVEGFEALARWTHPERGAIGPETFVSIAEESGLIVELGAGILEMAVREAARWDPPVRIAVNLSPAQFQDPALTRRVEQLLASSGLAPERLVLEITENVLVSDTAAALKVLEQLRGLGVRIAMDDFGTGYSSLSYFRLFPFDKVKIDRSFVGDMAKNPQALAVVQAIIGLGRGLDLAVVAEGVETEDQLTLLRREGCTLAQGFHIGRPQPIAFFESVVRRRAVREVGPSVDRRSA